VIAAPDAYRIRCWGCVYTRAYGVAKLKAEIEAAKHRLRHPDHVVRIYNGNKFVRQFPDKIAHRDLNVTRMSSQRDPSIPF